MPVFASNIVLKWTYACPFMHCLWLLCTVRTDLNSCNRDYIASKTKNTYDLNLLRKVLLIPALEVRSKIKVKLTRSPVELGWQGRSLLIGCQGLEFQSKFWDRLTLVYWTNLFPCWDLSFPVCIVRKLD